MGAFLGNTETQAAPASMTYTAGQEARAKANGFRNAEQMMLWAKQRNTPSGGTIPSSQSAQAGWDGVKMLHPSNLLGYISDAMNGATK